MDENQRELATNRLLEIIRGKSATADKGIEPPKKATAAVPPARVAPARPPVEAEKPQATAREEAKPVVTPEKLAPSPVISKRTGGSGLLDQVLAKPGGGAAMPAQVISTKGLATPKTVQATSAPSKPIGEQAGEQVPAAGPKTSMRPSTFQISAATTGRPPDQTSTTPIPAGIKRPPTRVDEKETAAKPSAPPMQISSKALKPETVPKAKEAPTTKTASSLQWAVKAAPQERKPSAIISSEMKTSAPPESADENGLTDVFLPLPERLMRRLQGSAGKKPGGKAAKGRARSAESFAQPKPPRLTGLNIPLIRPLGKRTIALDIGSSSIKIVELVKQRGVTTILNLAIRQHPPTQRKAGGAQTPNVQTKMLRELLPPERLRNAELHIVIPDKAAQARTVSIPGGSAKEVVNAIKFQIKKDLPFPLDVSEISYRGFNTKAIGKQEVEVLAADRRAIEGLLKYLDELEVLPKVVTAAPASARFLLRDFAGVTMGAGAVVLVDIGASKTSITMVDGDRVMLSRTIATGGNDFTDVLTGVALGPNGEELTEAQAEKYKIDVGLPSERDPGMMKIAILMRPVAERISTEINRSLDFYRRERPGGEIKKIVLCGGGALLKRLPEFLSENIAADIIVGKPEARLNLRVGANDEMLRLANVSGPLFLPALGVALDDGKELNMVPPSIKAALRLKVARGVIAPIVVGVMVMLLLIYTVALTTRSVTEHHYAKIKEQLRDLDQWRGKNTATESLYSKLVSEMRDRQADFDSIKIGEADIPRYLKALSNLVPENVYIENMETKFLSDSSSANGQLAAGLASAGEGANASDSVMSRFTKLFGNPFSAQNETESHAPVKRAIYGRVMEMNGSIYPSGSMTDVQFVDFVFSLENSGHFRDVAVDSLAVEESGKIKFRILCGL